MAGASPSLDQQHVHYAGFWVRFFAAVIDMVLFVPFYFAYKYGFDHFLPHDGSGGLDSGLDYMSAQILPSRMSQWVFEGVFDVVSLIIYAGFFASPMQASPGMYLFRFHICDKHGGRISFMRGLMWCITAVLGWLVCFGGVLYMQKDIGVVTDMMNSCKEQNIDISDCITEIEKVIGIPFASFQTIVLSAAGLAVFLYIVWALSIALPKDKTGFHNLICGTRLVSGRA